jgi:hypothetical protein
MENLLKKRDAKSKIHEKEEILPKKMHEVAKNPQKTASKILNQPQKSQNL